MKHDGHYMSGVLCSVMGKFINARAFCAEAIRLWNPDFSTITGGSTRGDPIVYILSGVGQRWPAKFGQVDKWKLCLRAARMPRIGSDHDETREVAGFVETVFRPR